MRVACIQMCSGRNVAENVDRMRDLVGEAAAQGAVYIQTPEMTGILENDGSRLLQSIFDEDADPVFKAASALAAEHGIYLHVGSTAVRRPKTGEDGRAANRGALFGPDGARRATYDKIHMFDVAVDEHNQWQESRRYAPGSQAVLADVCGTGLGMAICYDIRFPALYRQLAVAGACILTCPAAFTFPTGQAHWETLLRARAIENGAFMIAAAQGGIHEDGRRTWGHSMVVTPWGEIAAVLDNDNPGVLVADIDPGECEKARQRIPNLADAREFDLSINGNE